MKHHTKLVLGGIAILAGYSYLLFSDLVADKFAIKIIGLFILPLAIALIVIGFIERYYKNKKLQDDGKNE